MEGGPLHVVLVICIEDFVFPGVAFVRVFPFVQNVCPFIHWRNSMFKLGLKVTRHDDAVKDILKTK
jgi:hypothetical protein